MIFMHFHNSSTRNCDHHILLIMTGNAHKESCHKLPLMLVREQRLIKTDCSGEIVVAFTIKKKLFNGKSILQIGAICICVIKFLIWLRYWSCFRHSDKRGYCSLYIHFTNFSGHDFMMIFVKLGILLQ